MKKRNACNTKKIRDEECVEKRSVHLCGIHSSIFFATKQEDDAIKKAISEAAKQKAKIYTSLLLEVCV